MDLRFTPQEVADMERTTRMTKIHLAKMLMFASTYRPLTEVEIELQVNLAFDPEVRHYMAVATTSLQKGDGWPPV